MRSAALPATARLPNSNSRRRTRPCAASRSGPDGNLWCTENFANKIGHMAPDGTLIGEYDIPTPASGARCIAALSNGRLYFTQYDAGLIGEIVLE